MLDSSQLSILDKIGKECTIQINNQIESRLGTYIDELKIWNKKTNLISKHDDECIFEKHIVESLSILAVVDIPVGSAIVDIGSGAGFPGIPLSIFRPDLRMILVESKRMKSGFLRHIASTLQLQNLTVLNDRVENVAVHSDLNGKIDFVVARAVTNLKKLYGWAGPLLTVGGSLLALKGNRDEKDIEKIIRLHHVSCEINLIDNSIIPKERDLVLVAITK